MAKMTLDQKDRSLAIVEQQTGAASFCQSDDTASDLRKGGKPVKKKISLRSVIENSVRFALSGSSVDFRIKIDEDLWLVNADEGQIGQVSRTSRSMPIRLCLWSV